MAVKKEKVYIYDTTLRDGTQGEGVSFSKADKLRITQALDAFGVDYIEGGWPGSNPKDLAYFKNLWESYEDTGLNPNKEGHIYED